MSNQAQCASRRGNTGQVCSVKHAHVLTGADTCRQVLTGSKPAWLPAAGRIRSQAMTYGLKGGAGMHGTVLTGADRC